MRAIKLLNNCLIVDAAKVSVAINDTSKSINTFKNIPVSFLHTLDLIVVVFEDAFRVYKDRSIDSLGLYSLTELDEFLAEYLKRK